MLLTRTVAPTTSPVSLLDAREHLRVDSDVEDRVINRMLASAVASVGAMAGRSLAPETWVLSLPYISGDLTLPKSPVTEVSGVSYYDASDTLQTFDLAGLHICYSDDYTILSLKSGYSWPSASTRPDAIKVTFTAGYTTVPDDLVTAVLLMLGHLDSNREATTDKRVELPIGVEAHVALHRLGWAAG